MIATAAHDPIWHETALEQAERHVTQAHRMWRRQMAIVQRLRDVGADTQAAQKTLTILQDALANFERHRDYLRERYSR